MVDYTLYLVTDSTMIPQSSTFIKQVEQSINNGATIVQLREKSLSTLDFIERAQQVHELTKAKQIPLIINDRVDVALAIDAEGVHVGQDDMPAKLARQLLGENKILGVTCSTPEEVQQVVEEGIADYVGLGTVYQTNTKKDVTDPQGTGPIGVRKMLQVLKKYNDRNDKKIQSVAIGGINHSNADKVMYQCSIPGERIDGVAVVSCIMASEDAGKATTDLLKLIKSNPIWINDYVSKDSLNLTAKMTESHPLVHHITNNVVKNFSANVTLAIGASPIMSELPNEFEEFTKTIPKLALVLNLGTPNDALMGIFKHAIHVYNKYNKPIIFDPVACGATSARLECSRMLLNSGHMTVIKGNVGEISGIWKLSSNYQVNGNQQLMRGVDSIAEIKEEQIVKIAREVAVDFKTIVVVTGAINYVIDATRVEKISGGSVLMGSITGSGCSLGSCIGAFLGGCPTINPFDSTVAGVKLYNKAGKIAAKSANSPGSFMVKFLDELYKITH